MNITFRYKFFFLRFDKRCLARDTEFCEIVKVSIIHTDNKIYQLASLRYMT